MHDRIQNRHWITQPTDSLLLYSSDQESFKQAEWSIETNDAAAAAKMWIAAGEFEKAIKILTEQRDAPALHALARTLTKMQVKELQMCASAFTMMDQHEYAREVFVKLP